jgi:hypothetical protein
MAAVMEEQQAIFENVGQAVHVAFLIMAQEATQDAPLRMALIRIMESIKLDSGNQRNWLDQLRGERGAGTVNFEGLSPGDIRAQCALITQAVTTNLPPVEQWVLQAKYGQTDFEDVVDDVDAVEGDPLQGAIERARGNLVLARRGLDDAGRAFRNLPDLAARRLMIDARANVAGAQEAVEVAEGKARAAAATVDQVNACRMIDNGRAPAGARTRRRWAFSAERIVAIRGLSDWFAPMFPRIKPLAIDCLMGMLYANHKKIEISTRDLAKNFGGSHMNYYRASCKIRNHLRKLEESALARLEPAFTLHGVSCGK